MLSPEFLQKLVGRCLVGSCCVSLLLPPRMLLTAESRRVESGFVQSRERRGGVLSDTLKLFPSGRTNNAVGSTPHESTQRHASTWRETERDDASPPIVVHMMAAGAIALIRPATPRRRAFRRRTLGVLVPHTESSVNAQRKSVPCRRFVGTAPPLRSYRQGAPASHNADRRSLLPLLRCCCIEMKVTHRSCVLFVYCVLPTPLGEAIIIPMRLGQRIIRR
jgi:hypothetical protein